MIKYELRVYFIVSRRYQHGSHRIERSKIGTFGFNHLFPAFSPLAFIHPKGINQITTSSFSIQIKDTLTGMKLVLVVPLAFSESTAAELLNIIYISYTDYVLKDPFYALDMPIRCSLFDKAVKQVLAIASR